MGNIYYQEAMSHPGGLNYSQIYYRSHMTQEVPPPPEAHFKEVPLLARGDSSKATYQNLLVNSGTTGCFIITNQGKKYYGRFDTGTNTFIFLPLTQYRFNTDESEMILQMDSSVLIDSKGTAKWKWRIGPFSSGNAFMLDWYTGTRYNGLMPYYCYAYNTSQDNPRMLYYIGERGASMEWIHSFPPIGIHDAYSTYHNEFDGDLNSPNVAGARNYNGKLTMLLKSTGEVPSTMRPECIYTSKLYYRVS